MFVVQTFVVLSAFETYRLHESTAVFATVRVFVNRLAVLNAFDAYRLPVTRTRPVNAAVFATVSVFVNTLIVLTVFDA